MKNDLTVWQPIGCEGINLDGFDNPADLWQFWSDASSIRPIALARVLFPSQPKGYVRATRDLGCYASNKATAMQQRVQGNVQTAQSYEHICESIYSRLPEFAKW